MQNPTKTFNKTKKNQTKIKENKQKLYFYLFFYSFLCLHPSEGVPGVDLDMPDSILTSLDLRNHQKHPKQRKNAPKKKSKLFFSGPLFAYRVPLKGPYIGPDETHPPDLFRHPLDLKTLQKHPKQKKNVPKQKVIFFTMSSQKLTI